MSKPKPVVVTTVCSLCDEPWEDHGDNPTAEDCVRLLKAKLALSPQVVIRERPWWHQPVIIQNPPYYVGDPPYYTPRITCTSGTSSNPKMVAINAVSRAA